MAVKHWAIYGAVKMLRTYCNQCKGMTLIVDGIKQCCDGPVKDKKINRTKRMIEGGARHKPGVALKKEILGVQNNRCLYCNLEFGTPYIRNNKILYTKLHFDHLIPYSYSKENRRNFVAACSLCNRIKSNLMFDTVEEAYHYILHERNKRGIKLIHEAGQTRAD